MFAPAARLNDMHVCPMQTPAVVPIPHVGGPIMGPCVPTVLVESLPAAVVTDMCICVGPPDVIVMGSMSVMIAGKPAARVGDQCAHGGTIVQGATTVMIGDNGGGAGGGQAATMRDARNNGSAFTETTCGVKQTNEPTPKKAATSSSETASPATRKRSWIEIELLDSAGKPVPHERYRIVSPDREKHEGFLDDKGFARVDDIDPGTCQVTFPDMDAESWKPE